MLQQFFACLLIAMCLMHSGKFRVFKNIYWYETNAKIGSKTTEKFQVSLNRFNVRKRASNKLLEQVFLYNKTLEIYVK